MDEPALKSQLKLTIIRHKDFPGTFSNSRLLTSEKWPISPDWFVDQFETTVNMSTYLMAFAVTDFKMISKMSDRGVRIEVAARPKAIDDGEGDYGLEQTAKIIDFFSDYFKLEYPLKKSSKNFKLPQKPVNLLIFYKLF